MRSKNHFTSYIGLAVALSFAACQSDFCRVTGTVSGLSDGDTLLLTTDFKNYNPTDTILVAENSFQWETVAADTARLCQIWPLCATQRSATFFIERGNVRISIDSTHSYVAGTRLNDRWQSLNDSVSDYSQRIDRTIRTLLAAGTPPSIVYRRVSQLYEEMEKLVASTAERNKDNELGRLLQSH